MQKAFRDRTRAVVLGRTRSAILTVTIAAIPGVVCRSALAGTSRRNVAATQDAIRRPRLAACPVSLMLFT